MSASRNPPWSGRSQATWRFTPYDERQRDRQALAGSLRPEARQRRARGTAQGAGQGHHAGRVDTARSPGPRRGLAGGDPSLDGPIDPPGNQWFPGVGEVHVHRGSGAAFDRPGAQGRGPGGGPFQLHLRGLHPGRQDAHGTSVTRAELVHPPLTIPRFAGGSRGEDCARRCSCARRPAST